MKKITIKAKITIWYSSLIIILMIIVLFFLFSSATQIFMGYGENNLKKTTINIADEIEIDNNFISFDDDFKLSDNGVSILVFNKDRIIAGAYPIDYPLSNKIRIAEIYKVKNNNKEWLTYDLMINENIYVRGIQPLNELTSSMKQLLTILLIVFPFIIILSTVGGFFITKKAFKPIGKMAKTASEIGSGNDLSQRINLENKGDELSSLSQSFDLMLHRLEQSFIDEKQFTSDVSHELRTPLAVLKTQCEYALTQENNEITKNALLDIMLKTDQMSTLISQLLELSRKEKQIDKKDFEIINISELVFITASEMEVKASKKKITIIKDIEKDILFNCNQTLMMRLIINLFDNAIKYSENNPITITLKQNEEEINLSIKDNGVGIKKEYQDKIFNRFYQINPARNKENGNSFGLGLSFCKWIAFTHQGSIEVQSELGKGSTFIIHFPRK